MVASTGIAATLLINGTTAHRKMFLPINMNRNTCRSKVRLKVIKQNSVYLSQMKMESHRAEELRGLSVLIFDEATLADVFVFEAIDHLLRDVTGIDRPFGGKIVLLGVLETSFLERVFIQEETGSSFSR